MCRCFVSRVVEIQVPLIQDDLPLDLLFSVDVLWKVPDRLQELWGLFAEVRRIGREKESEELWNQIFAPAL